MRLLILVVDDEPAILQVIHDRLDREGFEVHTAKTGEQALARGRELQPDLIQTPKGTEPLAGIQASCLGFYLFTLGIPEADLPKLFREFFRAANAKRRRIPGSGVGLAGGVRISRVRLRPTSANRTYSSSMVASPMARQPMETLRPWMKMSPPGPCPM